MARRAQGGGGDDYSREAIILYISFKGGAIIRGRRLIEGRLLFEEIRLTRLRLALKTGMLFKLSKQIRKILCELYFILYFLARKFSLVHFCSQKKSLFCSKNSTLYLLRTKEIVNPLLPKRGYYSIIPKQKFSYSHSNIPVQSPSMYYWQ